MRAGRVLGFGEVCWEAEIQVRLWRCGSLEGRDHDQCDGDREALIEKTRR